VACLVAIADAPDEPMSGICVETLCEICLSNMKLLALAGGIPVRVPSQGRGRKCGSQPRELRHHPCHSWQHFFLLPLISFSPSFPIFFFLFPSLARHAGDCAAHSHV
jgi:hypothetical protein